MGWLKLGARSATMVLAFGEDLKYTNPENRGIENSYPIVALSTPDDKLPFIPPDEVKRRTSAVRGGLFIVINSIVYDCTRFLKEHPGGEQIIKSFGGAECSWQFWRFHGKKEMEEFGRPLRVGRSEGIANQFKEPEKYVGLRRLGADEWD